MFLNTADSIANAGRDHVIDLDADKHVDSVRAAAEKAESALKNVRANTASRMDVGSVVGVIGTATGTARTAADEIRTGVEDTAAKVLISSVRGVLGLVEDTAVHGGVRGFLISITESALALLGYDRLLGYARDIFQGASDLAVKTLVFAVAKRTFNAWRPYLGFAPAIWEGILSNPINQGTLQFILHNWSDLALFLLDLVDPIKPFVFDNGDLRGETNPHNELDLGKSMNRHAVICQLQRLPKSLVSILRDEREDKSLGNFDMDARLESDRDDAIRSDVIQKPFARRETWIFINGIAGEYHWLNIALAKLDAKFGGGSAGTAREEPPSEPDQESAAEPAPESAAESAEPAGDTTARKAGTITAIFNRSDGILWDLIECAGERSSTTTAAMESIIQRTKSSRRAQQLLRQELSKALIPELDNPNDEQDPIVVIAHSQGCLLLRLVLEELSVIKKYQDVMQKRLMVMTFGNPSVDWDIHSVVLLVPLGSASSKV
ncbi:hypothetical protein ACHAQH_003013 [Verticillium albo-atrum]